MWENAKKLIAITDSFNQNSLLFFLSRLENITKPSILLIPEIPECSLQSFPLIGILVHFKKEVILIILRLIMRNGLQYFTTL